jgi:hypothetical protein
MDSMPPKSGSHKPLAGMVVILFLALFVGGWLYVDSVRAEMGKRIDALTAQVDALKSQVKSASEKLSEPAAPSDGWRVLSGKLGGYTFSLNVPSGYHLTIADSATATPSAYLVMDPTAENGGTPTPDMVITLVDVTKEPYASKLGKNAEFKGEMLYPTADGKYGFWITGWEDQVWPDFDNVAGGFVTP